MQDIRMGEEKYDFHFIFLILQYMDIRYKSKQELDRNCVFISIFLFF